MVQLEKDMAVIGAVNELLRQHEENIVINAIIVCEYTRMMEARSGYAVVNGFSAGSLTDFLWNHSNFFQYDPSESEKHAQPSFRLQTGNSGMPHEMGDIRMFVGRMLTTLDPTLNLPYAFLADMQLLDVLSGGYSM